MNNILEKSSVVCKICGARISLSSSNVCVIPYIPSSIFQSSNLTINLDLFECTVCGGVQVFDSQEILEPNYMDVHRSLFISETRRNEKKIQLQNFLTKYNLQGKSILEVGCGDGQFLDLFKELDVYPLGIETNEVNVKECLLKNHKVTHGSIFDITSSYDCICAFHFLEHIPSPQEFMYILYHSLLPEGLLLLEVPNYDYIEKKHLWVEFTREHLFYYRKRTLEYLLLQSGFTIEETQEYDNGLTLSVVARKCCQGDLSSMETHLEQDLVRFSKLCDELSNDFVIYGVGHNTQILVWNLWNKYQKKPKYLFDSNPKKCGCEVCGVKVYYKSELEALTDAQNIIVICGFYTQEVIKMLTTMLPDRRIIPWN